MKALAAVALVAFSLSAFSQTPATTGTITGKITDESGAVLPGVTVTATRGADTITSITDTTGAYTLRLAPGDYLVTITLSGFQGGGYFVRVDAAKETPYSPKLRVGVDRLVTPRIPRQFESDRKVELHADRVTAQGTTTLYRGNAQMTTDSVVIHADEIDFASTTRTADVRGNVTVRVLPIAPRALPVSK